MHESAPHAAEKPWWLAVRVRGPQVGKESLVPSLDLSLRDPRLEGKKLASYETSRPRDPRRSENGEGALKRPSGGQTAGVTEATREGGREAGREAGSEARSDVARREVM